MGKNRRIGTSQSGIIDAFVKFGRREVLNWCDKGYKYLRNLDDIYSNWFCVPKSIKITSVKPSGSVSLLSGGSAGIHYPHSEYYIRRIRVSKNSELIPMFRNSGYPIEDDIYSDNSYVVEFPIKEKYFKRSKKDVTIWEQFQNAVDYQTHWSDNQVSITITFKKEEEKDIINCLECFEDKLKGVSLFPSDDSCYKQAPYEEITKERYEEMIKNITPLELNEIKKGGIGENGCETDACLLKIEKQSLKNTKVIELKQSKSIF
jgi:hypothetical protein